MGGGVIQAEGNPSVGVSTIAKRSKAAARSASSLETALAAARTAADNRGRDIAILDLREVTPLFDYFVIATGSSRRQLHAISEEIDRVLEREMSDKRLGIEGYNESRWILLDYGDVVVHLFDGPTRDYYSLEQLWGGARRVSFDYTAEVSPVRRAR